VLQAVRDQLPGVAGMGVCRPARLRHHRDTEGTRMYTTDTLIE